MKLIVTGKQTISGRWVRIEVPCYRMIYPCATDSIVTYLKKDEPIKVFDTDLTRVELENVDECGCAENENNYYHICWWADVDGLRYVTLDFWLELIRITIYENEMA